MTYRFLSPAQQELAEAIDCYERAVPGLGLESLDEVGISRRVKEVAAHR